METKQKEKKKENRFSFSSELTGNSRQSQIELLIEEQGIELEAAKNPPYELYK